MSSKWSEQTLQSDLSLVAQPDTNKPFISKKDAFDRLLPYHIFAREEPKSKPVPALDRARSLSETAESARKRLKSAHETLCKEEQAEEFRNVCELCYLESSLIQQEKVTMAALTQAANANVFSLPSASAAPPMGFVRPPALQSLQMPYRSNWLQLQAAAHAHKPAQPSETTQVATSQAPQESSWVEVKSEPTDRQAASLQGPGTHTAVSVAQPSSQAAANQGSWQEVKTSMPAPGPAHSTAPAASSGWTEVKHDKSQQSAPLGSGALVSTMLSQQPMTNASSQGQLEG